MLGVGVAEAEVEVEEEEEEEADDAVEEDGVAVEMARASVVPDADTVFVAVAVEVLDNDFATMRKLPLRNPPFARSSVVPSALTMRIL